MWQLFSSGPYAASRGFSATAKLCDRVFFFEKQTNERRQRYRQSSGSTKYIAVVVGVDFTRMRRWIDCADEANSDCSSKDGWQPHSGPLHSTVSPTRSSVRPRPFVTWRKATIYDKSMRIISDAAAAPAAAGENARHQSRELKSRRPRRTERTRRPAARPPARAEKSLGLHPYR